MKNSGRRLFDIELLGDPEADDAARTAEWLRLFNEMTPRLMHFFRARVPDEDALEDLIAEIWRRTTLRIGTVRAGEAIWTWMTTIGANLLRDQWRSEKRQQQALGQPVPIEMADGDHAVALRAAGDFIDHDQASTAVKLIRGTVTDDEWQLLTMWAVEELTHQEIATRLGLTSSAACRQRVSRLCARVRRQLASLDEEVL